MVRRGLIKRFMPTSLFGRSLLILVTPLILVQAVTIYMFFNRHWEKILDRLAYGVTGEIAIVGQLLNEDDSAAQLEHISGLINGNLDLMLSYFPGAALETVSGRDDFHTHMGRALFKALQHQVPWPAQVNVDAREKWVDVSVQLDHGVATFLVPERRLYTSSGYVVLLWMLGTSFILLLIAVIFIRNQVKPIHRLAIAAERLGKGRDVPYFKAEGAREVRRAAHAFLKMRARIDRQIGQRTAMLAGVSHDLRTPLTRMTLQVAMMPDGRDKADLQADIHDMQKMIDAYLQFARGEGAEEAERADMLALLNRLADNARREGAVIEVTGDEGISLMLRPVAMERCFANLINNAVKYAPRVWVSLARADDAVVVHIDDDGPGVPPDLYEEVFKPFTRGEQSRNAKTGGVGLGLPIAQDIIHSHGGEVALSPSPHGGLRVSVTLPV